MDFLTILHYASGPIIGALIGAFTNFIAIKMLFRPLKPVKIGKFTLPFTPGVIPRHQEELAEALSNTVYNNFFSNTDIEGIFMSDEMADNFAGGIYNRLEKLEMSDITEGISEDSRMKIKEAIYNKLHEMILETDIEGMVAAEAEKIIKAKVGTGKITNLIINDRVTAGLSTYIGKQVAGHIKEHDLEILYPILTKQGEDMEQMNFASLADSIGADKETITGIIKKGYIGFMQGAKTTIAETFHIKEFIYNKIMELNPADIERLVNEAIKREMNYLVYLGGLLGFIIGIINIFI